MANPSSSIKIINAANPVREGSAIVAVDKRGNLSKINPVRSPSVVANSGCWDYRYHDVTYYTA